MISYNLLYGEELPSTVYDSEPRCFKQVIYSKMTFFRCVFWIKKRVSPKENAEKYKMACALSMGNQAFIMNAMSRLSQHHHDQRFLELLIDFW